MESIVPILLLPKHLNRGSSNGALLESLQHVLNVAYTATYCKDPSIFGTDIIRIADPAQFGDMVGHEGFVLALLQAIDGGRANGAQRSCEVVATGSVKDFGDGDIEKYLEWSNSVSGREWKIKKGTKNGPEKQQQQQQQHPEQVHKAKGMKKAELTAFAVPPTAQSRGLGAKVLEIVDWVVKSAHRQPVEDLISRLGSPMVQGMTIHGSPAAEAIEAIDVNQLQQAARDLQIPSMPLSVGHGDGSGADLVLIVIRELGTEAYYQRRGFKSKWSGPVPVGKWDCRRACTMVYMEKAA